MDVLTRHQITAALRSLGLRAGDVAFLHSSLSSMGYVEGGAGTVVNAFVDVLAEQGTLVVPTFTFNRPGDQNAVFDPESDVSEMGRITEAARCRPGAQRSCHLLHSVSALGTQATTITATHGPAAWAGDGPFWRLYELDAQILLMGVPYLVCTFFHVVEQLVQVSYRQWGEKVARIRDLDGTERPLPVRSFSPTPEFVGNDFNKFGALLEARGLVSVGPVGNAVARLFRARDALEVGVAEYRKDPLILVKTSDDFTDLPDGVMGERSYKLRQ